MSKNERVCARLLVSLHGAESDPEAQARGVVLDSLRQQFETARSTLTPEQEMKVQQLANALNILWPVKK